MPSIFDLVRAKPSTVAEASYAAQQAGYNPQYAQQGIPPSPPDTSSPIFGLISNPATALASASLAGQLPPQVGQAAADTALDPIDWRSPQIVEAYIRLVQRYPNAGAPPSRKGVLVEAGYDPNWIEQNVPQHQADARVSTYDVLDEFGNRRSPQGSAATVPSPLPSAYSAPPAYTPPYSGGGQYAVANNLAPVPTVRYPVQTGVPAAGMSYPTPNSAGANWQTVVRAAEAARGTPLNAGQYAQAGSPAYSAPPAYQPRASNIYDLVRQSQQGLLPGQVPTQPGMGMAMPAQPRPQLSIFDLIRNQRR